MMKLIILIACALIYLAPPANASLTYVYEQDSGIPSGLNVQIEYTIENEAGAVLSFNGASRTFTGSFDGLLDFRFSGSSITKTLAQLVSTVDFCLANPGPSIFCELKFDFSFGPGMASMSYLDTSDQFVFGEGFGYINTDNPSGHPCNFTGVCHFDGVFAQIPEPATIVLFGAGLVGLVALRRRKATH